MYVVACKSNFSGRHSICKDSSGKFIRFEIKEHAEKYAKKMRDIMGVGYHYWVEEE